MMEEINCNELLPNDLIIESADNQLYVSGAIMKERPGAKRSRFNRPFLIITISVTYVFVNIIQLFYTGEKFVRLNLILGDFSWMIGLKYHLKIAIILFCSLTICIESIHYYNYRMGIEPTYLSVFE